MMGCLHQVRCTPVAPYSFRSALSCPALQPWVFESIVKTGGRMPLLENYGYTGVQNL